ncbi:MAG: Transketolase, partial [Streblomastix strix]
DGQIEQEQKWSRVLTIISTGSEVHLSIAAAQLLSKSDTSLRVRVVSAPCLELFREQPAEYRSQVLGTQSGPHRQPSLILSVEAGGTMSWYEFAHVTMGIDTFGVSAPDKEVYKHFGFTPEGIAEKAKKALKVFEGANVADLVKLRI